MQKYEYGADCGSVAVGNQGFVNLYGNGIGDGSYDVYVDTKIGKDNTDFKEFVGVAECLKHTNIYAYDCEPFEEVVGVIPPGRYGVYHDDDGNMLFKKWEDYQ